MPTNFGGFGQDRRVNLERPGFSAAGYYSDPAELSKTGTAFIAGHLAVNGVSQLI